MGFEAAIRILCINVTETIYLYFYNVFLNSSLLQFYPKDYQIEKNVRFALLLIHLSF